MRHWRTAETVCLCLAIHIYIQYMWSALGFGPNPTSDAAVPRLISLKAVLMCVLSWQQRARLWRGRGGRSSYLCSGVSQAAPHALGGFSRVRNLPDHERPPPRRSAAAALTSVHVPVICQLLQSRSCVLRGIDLALQGSQATMGIYVEFARKSGLSAICFTQEEEVGASGHVVPAAAAAAAAAAR